MADNRTTHTGQELQRPIDKKAWEKRKAAQAKRLAAFDAQVAKDAYHAKIRANVAASGKGNPYHDAKGEFTTAAGAGAGAGAAHPHGPRDIQRIQGAAKADLVRKGGGPDIQRIQLSRKK